MYNYKDHIENYLNKYPDKTIAHASFLRERFRHLKIEDRRKNPYWQEVFNDLLNRTYGEGYYDDDTGPFHLYTLCRDAGKRGFGDIEKELVFNRHKKYIAEYVQRPVHINFEITHKGLDYFKCVVTFCEVFAPFFRKEDADLFDQMGKRGYAYRTLGKIKEIPNLDLEFVKAIEQKRDIIVASSVMDKIVEMDKIVKKVG